MSASGKAARQTATLLSSLRALNCPHVKDVDETRFSDLVFQPCEWRQKLLLWFLSKMDSAVAQTVSTSAKGSVLSRLHDVFSSCGLCAAERQDLVSGSARRLDQLAFFIKLVHAVELIEHQRNNNIRDDAIVDSCVKLMNDGLSRSTLHQVFGSPVSYLPPELGLQFRSEVEKRKAVAKERQEEPLLWKIHAWGNEVMAQKKAQSELMERLPPGEFQSVSDCEKQSQVLQQLAAGVERYESTHRRVFKSACDQRRVLFDGSDQFDASARREKEARLKEFGSKFHVLGNQLESMEILTDNVERMEEELKRIAIRAQQQPESLPFQRGLASEICAFAKELK